MIKINDRYDNDQPFKNKLTHILAHTIQTATLNNIRNVWSDDWHEKNHRRRIIEVHK